MLHKLKNNLGFTLLEILLVVVAIGILAGIVILAINPSKQLGETRNAQRQSDVKAIIDALYQYSLDNGGSFPSGIPTAYSGVGRILGTPTFGCNTCTSNTSENACADVESELVPDYLVALPMDPQTGSSTKTNYYVHKNSDGRLVVGACDPEQSATISISR